MKPYSLIFALIILSGCNPFNERTNKTKKKIKEGREIALSEARKYEIEFREIQDYNPYMYETEVEDPFRAKTFLLLEQEPISNSKNTKCEPPECSPPVSHEKSFLEDYNLKDLVFVGTLSKFENVGLIKTPDLGVVRVKKGDFIGQNNGKILAIKETAIVIQEKIYKSGLWENKKTVLMINK